MKVCPECKTEYSGLERFCANDGTRLVEVETVVAEPDPFLGSIIQDRYKINEFLGDGPTGRVYKAEHAMLGTVYAVKVLEVQASTAQITAFRKTAARVGSLNPEFFIKVHDFGPLDSDRHYLVMDYVECENLGSILAHNGPMEPADAIDMALKVTRALELAHAQDIMHLNLKPSNVLLRGNGSISSVVKISDFGISHLTDLSKSPIDLARMGLLRSSATTMAPEMIEGRAADKRTDIYGLGLLLHSALSGRAVFGGSNDVAILEQVLQGVPGLPQVNGKGRPVPTELVALVNRMTSRNAAHRPSSASEVLAALKTIAATLNSAIRQPVMPVGTGGSAWQTGGQSVGYIPQPRPVTAVPGYGSPRPAPGVRPLAPPPPPPPPPPLRARATPLAARIQPVGGGAFPGAGAGIGRSTGTNYGAGAPAFQRPSAATGEERLGLRSILKGRATGAPQTGGTERQAQGIQPIPRPAPTPAIQEQQAAPAPQATAPHRQFGLRAAAPAVPGIGAKTDVLKKAKMAAPPIAGAVMGVPVVAAPEAPPAPEPVLEPVLEPVPVAVPEPETAAVTAAPLETPVQTMNDTPELTPEQDTNWSIPEADLAITESADDFMGGWDEVQTDTAVVDTPVATSEPVTPTTPPTQETKRAPQEERALVKANDPAQTASPSSGFFGRLFKFGKSKQATPKTTQPTVKSWAAADTEQTQKDPEPSDSWDMGEVDSSWSELNVVGQGQEETAEIVTAPQASDEPEVEAVVEPAFESMEAPDPIAILEPELEPEPAPALEPSSASVAAFNDENAQVVSTPWENWNNRVVGFEEEQAVVTDLSEADTYPVEVAFEGDISPADHPLNGQTQLTAEALLDDQPPSEIDMNWETPADLEPVSATIDDTGYHSTGEATTATLGEMPAGQAAPDMLTGLDAPPSTDASTDDWFSADGASIDAWGALGDEYFAQEDAAAQSGGKNKYQSDTTRRSKKPMILVAVAVIAVAAIVLSLSGILTRSDEKTDSRPELQLAQEKQTPTDVEQQRQQMGAASATTPSSIEQGSAGDIAKPDADTVQKGQEAKTDQQETLPKVEDKKPETPKDEPVANAATPAPAPAGTSAAPVIPAAAKEEVTPKAAPVKPAAKAPVAPVAPVTAKTEKSAAPVQQAEAIPKKEDKPPIAETKPVAAAKPVTKEQPATTPSATAKEANTLVPAAKPIATAAPAAPTAPTTQTKAAESAPPITVDTAGKSVDELIEDGNSYIKSGKFNSAEQAFRAAAKLMPRNAAVQSGLGDVAFEKQEFGEAVQYHSKSVELAPRNAGYHNKLGMAYFRAKNYPKAAEHWERTMELNPNDTRAKAYLRMVQKKLEQ